MDGKRRGRSMKSTTTPCIPIRRFRSNRPSTIATPMSLMERFREVVFRLIMFSAISKNSPTSSSSPRSSPLPSPVTSRAYNRHQDSYRSEAVEDCIEFFKRSAGSVDGAKSSNVSEDSVDVTLAALPLSPVWSECESLGQF